MAEVDNTYVGVAWDSFVDWHYIDEAEQREAESAEKSLGIIMFGKPGAGKSTLVVSLLGSGAAKMPLIGSGMQPVTTATESYIVAVSDVRGVKIYDTRGIFDVSGGHHENETIRKVGEVCNNDCTGGVLLICIEMHERIDRSTMERILALLHRTYLKRIWKVTVIALTKADRYPESEWLRSKKWYQSKQKVLKEKFEGALREARQYLRSLFTSDTVGMSEEEFDELAIPILPTSQLTTDAMSKMEKVGYESWFDTLLETCCTRKQGAAFVKIHSKRLSTKRTKAASVAVGTVCGVVSGVTVAVPTSLIPILGKVVGGPLGGIVGGTVFTVVSNELYCYLRRRQRKEDPRFGPGGYD